MLNIREERRRKRSRQRAAVRRRILGRRLSDGFEPLEPRIVLASVTLLSEDFESDTVGSLPASPDQFWNAAGPEAFIQVAGPGGYADPFGGLGNQSLVIDNPGAAQPIVAWRSMFPDNPAEFHTGSVSFDLYLPEPDPGDTWTYVDIRLGYGGPARTAPTTVGDTTVWNSFRVRSTAADIVFDNGSGAGQAVIASNTTLHVVYELNGANKTYTLSINGTPIGFGSSDPNRAWIAGAPGVNMIGFFGAFPATSSPVYIDNLVVVNDEPSDPPPPWTPGAEPTDVGEWLQHRGNKRLTGESTLAQDIVGDAEVVWSQYVGSRESWAALTPATGASTTVDLPTTNVSMSSAERMSWGIGGPYFDLAGNGQLTAASTGSLTRIGDFITGNGVLEKIEGEVLDPTFGQGVIRLYIYSGGTWVQQWQSPVIPSMFGIPNLITGDFDNDGAQEIALTPWNDIYILNMATGQVERTGTFKPPANQSGRGYGWFGAYDLTGDGREEFFVMGDFQDFISVVTWDAANNLVPLWNHVISPNLAGKQTAHRPGAFPVRDVTGDGQLDVVTSIFNETGDDRWHLVIRNALTGAVTHDLVDHVVDAARDVDGDGDYELFVRSTSGALLSPTSTLSVLDVQGAVFQTLWTQANAGFVSQDMADYPLYVNSATSTGKQDLLTGPLTVGGDDVFFTRTILDAGLNEHRIDVWQMDGAGGFEFIGSAEGAALDVLAVRPASSGVAGALLASEVVGADAGQIAVDGFTGLPVYSQGSGPPRASAVVGRLDGPDSPPIVVVEGGSQTINAFQPLVNGAVNPVWTRSGIGGYTGATQFTGQHEHSGVALADVTGDGSLETLYAAMGESGQARLTAVDSAGAEVWHADFDVPGGPRVWNQPGLTLWRTGHFTTTDHEDVLVQLMRGSGGTGEFVLLDGLTGEEIWTRSYGNTPGSSPIQRNAGEAQMAVYDWDGDGLDEAVNFHPDMFYVVDGTGVNLVDASVYNGGVFPGGSPLYGAPVVADFLNNGTDTILFAGSYSQFGLIDKNGGAVWNTPFVFDNTPGFIQGVGDVDGDGDLDLLSPGHPVSAGVDTSSKFHAYDAATGQLLWTVDLPGRAFAPVGGAYYDTPTLSVSGDVDNDGRVESVFAIAGTLYVVGADPGGTSGSIEWSFTPDGGALGSPIIADANGDGQLEIIVVSTSGYVYGIGAPPHFVPGDLNGDDVVDIFDVAVVSGEWGAEGLPGLRGDANFDGRVDIFDVAVVSNNWTTASVAAAQEAALTAEPSASSPTPVANRPITDSSESKTDAVHPIWAIARPPAQSALTNAAVDGLGGRRLNLADRAARRGLDSQNKDGESRSTDEKTDRRESTPTTARARDAFFSRFSERTLRSDPAGELLRLHFLKDTDK